MQKNILIVLSVLVLLVVGGGSFYGGMIYSKSQRTMPNFGNGNFQGVRNGTNGNGAGGGMTSGEITAKDSNSITVKLPNSKGSKIIFFSSDTQITKSASGTSEDLANGVNVSIIGTANTDGSITAKSIQLMPTIHE